MSLEQISSDIKRDSVGDFFKFPQGATRVRILTDIEKVVQIWEGEKGRYVAPGTKEFEEAKSYQGYCWAWVYSAAKGEEGELRILTLAKTILSALMELKANPDYEWEGFPIPFDISVSRKGEKLNTEYTVIASPKRVEVPTATIEALNKKKSIPTIVASIIEKQNDGGVSAGKGYEYPEGDDKAIPF